MISKILTYIRDVCVIAYIKYNVFLIRQQNISWTKKSIRQDTKKLHKYYIKSHKIKKDKNIEYILEYKNNVIIKKSRREIIYITKGDYRENVIPEMKSLILTYERSIEKDKENLKKIMDRKKKP